MKKLASKNLQIFDVRSIWLESDDYPKLLGSADLGVCLHYSSSGFDLPMKVVDMFSSALPVCAFRYDTINELVNEHINGLLFQNCEELSEQLFNFIKEFNLDDCKTLSKMRKNLLNFNKKDWISQWKDKVLNKIVLLNKKEIKKTI